MSKPRQIWTYLQHLKAQKHQFALYMKSKNAEFLDSLLQQLKFEEVEKDAPTEEGADAAAVKQKEGESEEDEQPKPKEAEDAEAETESSKEEKEKEEDTKEQDK